MQVVDAPHLKETFGVSLGGIGRVLKAIPEWRNRRSGMLTTNFAEAGGFVKSQASEAIPDLQLHFVVGKLIDHGRKTVFGHGYSAHVCVLRPQSRGSVTLASADPFAAPLIDPNFFDHPDDMQRLVRGFRLDARRDEPARAGKAGRQGARAFGQRHDATPTSSNSSAPTATPSTTRWAPAAWARARWTSWAPTCASTAWKASAWSTPR